MSVEERCMDICEEIVDCSTCTDEACEKVCDEVEDRCLGICAEVLG